MNPSFISYPEPKLNLCKVNKNQDRLFLLHTNSQTGMYTKKLSQRFTAPAKQLINRHIYKKERYLNSCKQDKVRIVIIVDVTS